ncbi:MAG: hypothetical protein LBT79_00740 [Elusimicrobiota bacterium]|jgi:hypothetical protein|nr:hypothetical protein [Elusimicrobiota bacterium]
MAMYDLGDMSKEKPSNEVFKEGKQLAIVDSMTLEKSKKGNRMFVISLTTIEDSKTSKFYLVLEEGKRWLLRTLLEATGTYQKDANNNYSFDPDQIVGKTVGIDIKNGFEDYINKKNEKKQIEKSQLKAFFKAESGNKPIENKDKSFAEKIEEDDEILF